MRILGREDVRVALADLDSAVIGLVRDAYVLHGQGKSDLPFSTFLRPLHRSDSRIIALPAYLGGPAPVMGLKWISSFPENVKRGMQRASSLCILNDLESGYPLALMEGSQISAVRTAAGAALASGLLNTGREVRTAGLVGCGTINHRVTHFLTQVHGELETVLLQDAYPERAEVFAAELAAEYPDIAFRAAPLSQVLTADTVSIATTDSTYWLDLAAHPQRPHGQVVLHLSLRDLSVGSVLDAVNVVDDADHAIREQTSLHKAELRSGHRRFVTAEIGALLDGTAELPDGARTVVFSPFGLGVLDLAVAEAVLNVAEKAGLGTEVDGFDPGTHKVTSHFTGSPA
ncbi:MULTISPECIES: 2,3-diaminopropionate biosynthesis protein SbnB [Kitasatospora]|uniref:Putative ornithine cyclodeaminase n=1 Tax=Kitasatospora setae (strain ATCC 33774 / DSM 43861 / JCM 3304 / KCC A-0304 / NBRC 14216 / KM-6054) TaxID=452652 RepID=E4MZT7_KITSK|nr:MULTISPECIES: 2,3-diaminopropionate biosynthesis protein SbnB [Kitasatospora]BAJ30021.1 putative ornithine cyclodeaminase [Kitasatospora setae KM-6054]